MIFKLKFEQLQCSQIYNHIFLVSLVLIRYVDLLCIDCESNLLLGEYFYSGFLIKFLFIVFQKLLMPSTKPTAN